tara:strand:+ start:44900 stop:45487 length:588 start_codon:yes stop_codon:yes gene_type:complete
MEKNVVFRALIEVVGKPRKHVEESLKKYVENLGNDKLFEITGSNFAKIKKQDEQEMWAGFAEVDIKTAKIEDLTYFCFQYMPSMIEIIEPKEFVLNDGMFTNYLNDLQAKLHHVDMIAKSVKMENDALRRNGGRLLKNYVVVLLNNENMAVEKLSGLTGVPIDQLADFLDQLIDESRIDLKDDIYFVPTQKLESK